MLAVLSVPSLPCDPLPQQASSPFPVHGSFRTAHVISSPALICVAILPSGKSTKERLPFISPPSSPMVSVLPIPSCPYVLSPQQAISPSSQSTQVCLFPTETCESPCPLLGRWEWGRESPDISAIVSPIQSVLPIPSCPYVLPPQHTSASEEELLMIAHACIPPASIAVAFQSPM